MRTNIKKTFPSLNHKKNGITRRFHTTAALLVAVTAISFAATPSSPRLTVGIFIDGLEYDRLIRLKDSFGKNGFARFLNHGVVIPSVDYGTPLDATAATALAVTGASPWVNGLTAESLYDPSTSRMTHALDDPDAMGNFTSETFSPKALLSSTLSDEAKIAGGGVGYTYSVACDPGRAIILAGHAGDGALWLNSSTGAWAGSTFYPEMPTSVVTLNRLSPLSARLDTMSWVPTDMPRAFEDLPEHLTAYPFRYVFPRGDAARYDKFAASPLASAEIARVTSGLIKSLSLGTHQGPDMVNVSFSLQPFEYTRNPDNRYELADAYLRTDRAIGDIVENAEKMAGKENCLFYLIATPGSSSVRRDDEKWKIPYGEFSVKKAMSLLNMYLMALYGNGDWVKASDGTRFYLNHETIKARDLRVKDVRHEAASFLLRMSGIRNAFTLDDILDGKAGDNPSALKRNTHPASTFDVMVSLRPGWTLVDDFNASPGALKKTSGSRGRSHSDSSNPEKKVERLSQTHAPALILSPALTPRTLPAPVDARMLAPTLARIMGIRAPNGAETPPLSLQ